ncbi:MAG: metal-dependent hydrolase [Bacillota bacterium]
MDPVSHALMGAAIGSLARSSDPAVVQAAYWSSMAGGVVPDVDIVVRYVGGEMAYLAYHRSWTHSLPGVVGLPAAVAVLLKWAFPTVPWLVLFLWALAGALSHVFLDVTNAYGTMALLPWSRRKLALDITMLVDLPLVGLVLAAILWTRAHPEQRVAAFSTALGLFLAYLVVRYILHQRLLRAAWKRFAGRRPTAISIMPGMVGLLTWYLLVETPERYLVGSVRVPGSCWHISRTFERRGEDDTVAAARRHPAAGTFLAFARHPHVETRRQGDRVYVTWGDLRFLFRDRPVLTLTVVLDQDNRPLDARLGRGYGRPEAKGGARA